ncbi:hypothetical protein GQ53DRAFT_370793 [Thozetella sp. PMI_491]|nr:hypothetical protein GQ53DRAFT_370793 [Thozetella sp. PMI_491]
MPPNSDPSREFVSTAPDNHGGTQEKVKREGRAKQDAKSRPTEDAKSRPKESKGRLLGKMHKMAGWLSTSEPSSQALKQHRKTTFERAGVDPEDPRASSKLHAPLGKIPEDAIRPSGRGPEPEEVMRKKMDQAKIARSSASAAPGPRSSHSSSSGFSAGSAMKGQQYKDYFPFP